MSFTANYYLTDFENCLDTEKLDLLQKTGAELITAPENWKDLISVAFDENQLKVRYARVRES